MLNLAKNSTNRTNKATTPATTLKNASGLKAIKLTTVASPAALAALAIFAIKGNAIKISLFLAILGVINFNRVRQFVIYKHYFFAI